MTARHPQYPGEPGRALWPGGSSRRPRTRFPSHSGSWMIDLASFSKADGRAVQTAPGQTARYPRISSVVKGKAAMASRPRIALAFLALCGAWCTARRMRSRRARPAGTSPKPVGFAREVRPILSDNCFACHGPDDKARKAGLRLDTKEGAFAKLESGDRAVVPGKPDESELIDRIENDDPDLRMPPRKSGKPLTARADRRAAALGRARGDLATHWAFEAAGQARAARRQERGPGRSTTIDRFILARLEAEGLSARARGRPRRP